MSAEIIAEPVEPSNIEELVWYTKTERCDQCQAQSYFMVTFKSGDIFLCNHHFHKNEAVIFETALDVVDESELLLIR